MHAVPTSTRREISVRPFDGRVGEWDAFVADAEAATFCHLAAWREIIADALGGEPVYLAATGADGLLEGVLPLVRVRSRLFGHYVVSMPFLNYGGPLGADDVRRCLVHAALQEAHRSGADLLEVRARDALDSALRPSARKVTVLLELPETTEELWEDRFSSRLRNNIRRPMREGMETRFGPGQCEAFYDVFARNMRELGTPVLPLRWFERIRDRLAEHAVFGAVYWKGQPVAAGCGFVWRGEFEMTWSSGLRKHSRRKPNMLLYWSFLEEMIRRRLRVFNFGRSTPGTGPHAFKLHWGGVDVPLPWGTWSPRGVAATPSPNRPLYRVATEVWKRLPLFATNRAGPLLARKIP